MGHLRWVVGIIISAIALYIAFVGVDWPAVGDALGAASYWLLLAALPVLIAVILMRAQRWRLLFYPDTHISLRSAFGALNIGYMAGAILPLQLGEVARVYVLSDTEKLPPGRVLSTVAIERLLDVFALLTILVVLVPFINLPAAAVISALVIVAGFLVFSAFVVVAVLDRPRMERWWTRLMPLVPQRFRPRAEGLGHSLLDGLSSLTNPKILFLALFWTFVSWMTSSLVVYLALRAFSLDVPFAAAPFLLIATTFGFFVPSSPGAIGVYHAIVIRTLTGVFSVPHEDATSYALVVHALYLIPPTIIGACFFWWNHLSLRRIRSLPDELEQAQETPVELGIAADGRRAP